MSARIAAALLVACFALAACSSVGTGTLPSSHASSGAITSASVVQAFKTAGLEAESAHPMTVEEWGLAQMSTDDATRFLIPSLGPDNGGRAFVFHSLDDLRAAKAYYDSFGPKGSSTFSWTYANEPLLVLVQINGGLADDKAAAYGQVVADLH